MTPVNGSKYRDKYPGITQIEKGRSGKTDRRIDLGTLGSKLNVSIKFLLSELRESCRRGGRKSVQARGDEGQQKNRSP